jgi:hypothetical protein
MSHAEDDEKGALRREAEHLCAHIDQLWAELHTIAPYSRPETEGEQRRINELYVQIGRAAAEYSRVWEYGPMTKYPCPCCGLHTLDEQPPGTYEICLVCWWEDDRLQYEDPTYRGGANDESLNEAREAFRRTGAIGPHGARHRDD